MEIDDLWEAVKNFNPTKEDREKFKQRMIEWEAEFSREDKARQITNEWLNKEYTL